MDADLSSRIEAAFVARRRSYEWIADEESIYEWAFDDMVQRHYYKEWRASYWCDRGKKWEGWHQIWTTSERQIRRISVLRDISSI